MGPVWHQPAIQVSGGGDGEFPTATWLVGPATSVCSRLTRDPTSKNKVEDRWEKILNINLGPSHEHTHRCTHMPEHICKSMQHTHLLTTCMHMKDGNRNIK